MNAHSSVDRESFQRFLASAFAVQESEIDSRFLSSFLGVQRSVGGGDLGIDGVMNLVVDSARDVADAAGVAIGLLERDQLVYRAGSGCSELWIGARFAASLTVSSKAADSREILRVENARTDSRIEGAICRQFGAESLLILPIYRDRLLAGVMEILFSEPHEFQDSEVRMYRLMARLIEEAVCRPVQSERNSAAGVPLEVAVEVPAEVLAVRNVIEEMRRRSEHFAERSRILYSAVRDSVLRRRQAALTAAQQSPAFRWPGLLAENMVQRATEVFANKPLRSLALSAVATGLGLTFWMSHGGRGPASRWESPAPSRSTAVTSLQPDVKPVDATRGRRLEPIPVPAIPVPVIPVPNNDARLGNQRNRRVRVGQTEVVYIGDDVTVRHFTRTPPRRRAASQVAHFGEDVTVRYFTPKPVVSSKSQ